MIKHILEKLAYTLVEDDIKGDTLQVVIINNPDGSPRWICPANAEKPYFLKFYNTGNSKARLIVFLFKFIFYWRLQRLFFKVETYYLTPSVSCKRQSFIDIFKSNWAIFTGTVGPNRKALIYQESEQSNYFFKIPFNTKSQKLIQKEAQNIKNIQSLDLQHTKIPLSSLLNQEILQLEDLSPLGKRKSQITQAHIGALTEIYEKTTSKTYTEKLPAMKEVKGILAKFKIKKDERLPKGLLKKLNKLYQILQYKSVEVALSHGDFTSWNMYVRHEKLYLYDWELAQENMPLGFDAFHFIIQQGILVERKSWCDIRQEIETKLSPAFQLWTKNNTWKDYLKMYLLVNTTKYLKIYSEQENWHVQVAWLLETWTNAISDMLKYEEENRKLLILDFFDFVQEKNYATIKFPDIEPENLDENSDIDVCIEQKDCQKILNFLKNQALVLHISKQQKSFMTSLKIFLRDDSILCLDLIWKFKRKALVMMDTRVVLASAQKNKFGIRCLSNQNLARYMGLFYGLNYATLPTIYKPSLAILEKSPVFLDFLLFQNAQKGFTYIKLIHYLLRKEKFNQFPQSFYNTLSYFWDTTKQFLWNRGMIITFSGVDGAGKSTVIENIKFKLEKKLRKRVVILRHRPSILPILSAWAKGKIQAEKEASENLPRQGKNKSTIGSYLRFFYYYTDYLLGQFYVYFKYLSRGYVVLYDRYYFDFMVDAKRSNIKIPQSISRVGYYFLLKPKLNFFLYADAETILKRKQELNKTTLTELTENYLSLFEKLDKKQEFRYFSIKNLKLEQTVEKVIQTFILKMI